MNQNIFKNGIEEDICTKGEIVIEEDVWIGSNSVILSGVKIGRGSVIGAGSIVTKDIPRYSVVAGNPAKIVKMRFSKIIINALEMSQWWEKEINYMLENKNYFRQTLSEEWASAELLK